MKNEVLGCLEKPSDSAYLHIVPEHRCELCGGSGIYRKCQERNIDRMLFRDLWGCTCPALAVHCHMFLASVKTHAGFQSDLMDPDFAFPREKH